MLSSSPCRSALMCLLLVFAAMLVPGRVAGADKDDIVGRWDVVRSGKLKGKDVVGYMRFKADGTFTSTLAFLTTTDGKHRFLSAKVVELDFPGVLFGRNKVEFKYRLAGDVLALEAATHSIDLEFKRVDSGK